MSPADDRRGDMGGHMTFDESERVVRGVPTGPHTAPLVETLGELRDLLVRPPAPEVAARHVAAMVAAYEEAASRGLRARVFGWWRETRVPALRWAGAAVGGVLAVLAVLSGLAATGALPDRAQELAADAASKVGIELPRARGEAGQSTAGDQVAGTTEAPPTTSAPATSAPVTETTCPRDGDDGDDGKDGAEDEQGTRDEDATCPEERNEGPGAGAGDRGDDEGDDRGDDEGGEDRGHRSTGTTTTTRDDDHEADGHEADEAEEPDDHEADDPDDGEAEEPDDHHDDS